MTTRKTTAVATAAALLAGGGALAASTTAQDPATTTVTVRAADALGPGDTSPFDVAGVRAIRRGRPIPAGYALVGRTVTIEGDGPNAGASLRFTCPAPKRLRSFAFRGRIGGQVVDPDYPGRRSTTIITGFGRRGTTTAGSAYAVCR